jgi:hypothetical protein
MTRLDDPDRTDRDTASFVCGANAFVAASIANAARALR